LGSKEEMSHLSDKSEQDHTNKKETLEGVPESRSIGPYKVKAM
jgi:hypothetical protein